MHKRPLGAGGSGLPAKPYTPPMPGPAPPLPAGPPPPQPPQQSQYQDPQAAAHAAAWAAYYQSQGQQGATYTPPGQPQQQQQQGTAANPYANYGYSAGAQQQHQAHTGYATPNAGPGPSTYRPPAPTPAPAPVQYPQHPPHNHQTPHVQAPYQPPPPPQQQQGYQAYQPQPQPQYGQAPQQSYNYQQQPQQPQPQQPQVFQPAQSVPRPPSQPYRPPQQSQQTQQPYYPPQPSSAQPAHPQQHQPYRPSPTPPLNRPYNPSPRVPSGPGPGPGRPPMNTSFPPAKRPRFDNTSQNNPVGQPAGPMSSMQTRPIRPPMGPNMGQPGFNHPPHHPHPQPQSHPRPPLPSSVPSAPSITIPSAPSAPRNSAPVTRPPIHLGLNGPPPSLPFGGPIRGVPPSRGMRGGGRGGLVNAPKGPRRVDVQRQNNREIQERKRKEKEREREREREAKTTMTDFRIVGIEVKELGWSWGMTGGDTEGTVEAASEEVSSENENRGEVVEEKEEMVESEVKEARLGEEPEVAEGEEGKNVKKTNGCGLKSENEEVKTGVEQQDEKEIEAAVEGDAEAAAGPGEPVVSIVDEDSEVKTEAVEAEVEEKRGEKRKAKTPEGDEGSSPKKRSGEYLLTHGKPNETNPSSNTHTSSHESNQNRFRIYFESPPELDRVPKALRRNPNKRWRRETSSVAPTPVKRGARDSTVATDVATVEEESEAVQIESAVVGDEGEGPGEGKVEAEGEGAGDSGDADLKDTQGANAQESDQKAPAIAPLAPAGSIEGGTEPEPLEEVPVMAEQPPASEAINTESTAQITEPQAATSGAAEAPGDISMMTDPGAVAAAISELVNQAEESKEAEQPTTNNENGHDDVANAVSDEEPKPEPTASNSAPDALSAAEAEAALAASAENTASAWKSRTRRRSSVSSVETEEPVDVSDIGTPSTNRVSILYEDSSRRLCVDASSVERVKVYRAEGKIEVVLNIPKKEESDKEDAQLPKGFLVEMYDTVDQRFVSASLEKLQEVWSESASSSTQTLPPLHRPYSGLTITVHLNKKRPLSEPKWCRTNSADEWLIEQFGAKKAAVEGGWRGKLEIVDPDPAPTLQTILDTWASSSSTGAPADRRKFTSSLLSSPNDLLEILLRLTRGDRNPTAASNGLGPLATAIRPDSPYASHQTHVSLAILAMYRLTTDYAAKAGESTDVVNEKISDIIKSLPVGMITRSLDGLFREWGATK